LNNSTSEEPLTRRFPLTPSYTLRGNPIQVRWRKKPIELLFNLEHPDELAIVTDIDENTKNDEDADVPDADENELQNRIEKMTFVIHTNKLARLPHWIPVSEVFTTESDAPFLKKAGVAGFEDPRYDKYSQRLKRLRSIRHYTYRMDILERSLSYEEVTEIFVRVNSLGAKLRGSDLATAQITAKWRDSLKVFERFQKECADNGFDLDIGIHVKNLIAFTTSQSRFLTVGGLSLDKLQAGWEAAQEGFRFAINFLKSNAHIESPALLSSPFLLISLGYFGHHCNYKLDAQQAAELRYWLFVANAKGRYSRGSSETLLDQDLARIRDGKGVAGLIETLMQQFGRLDVQPADLEGRNARSAYFKTMFLAFRQDGAKDWTSNLAISLSHGGKQHRLQFHHIFPRAFLKGAYKPTEVNDIANLAFVGGKTNRRISAKPPAEYLTTIDGAARAAQCIPNDDSLLTSEGYPQFVAKRRKLIAARLNRFLEDARKA